MGPLMINMAFMPLYMWEMWDVTPVTDEHTDEQWKVEQYSVWAESAIIKYVGYSKLFWSEKKITKIDVCRKKTALKWTWDQLFLLSLGCWLLVTNSKKKKKIQIWHAHHKATGMTIFCWAKTISNNSLILTNYFEKHLKLTHWYDGPIWIKPLKEVFFRSARASWNT